MRPTVLIIHPAWYSCGSATVFEHQVATYAAQGFEVLTFAVGMSKSHHSFNRHFWDLYYRNTNQMVADKRYHTGMPYSTFRRGMKIAQNLNEVTGTYARQVAAPAMMGKIPRDLLTRLSETERLHFHVNHYFTMPLATRLRTQLGRRVPIIFETHDIQAKQFALRGEVNRITKKPDTYEAMLEDELEIMRDADVLVHLNASECEFFKERLPEHEHRLVFPAVSTATAHAKSNALQALIVASNNHPNVLSTIWFLEHVWPLVEASCGDAIQLSVVGNIVDGVRDKHAAIYHKYADCFHGLVDSLAEYYRAADVVLLPTIEGHGISVKTIEAMSYGKSFVATPLAFRGLDTAELATVHDRSFPDTAEAFAAEIRAVVNGELDNADAAIAIYDRFFSMERYSREIAGLTELAWARAA